MARDGNRPRFVARIGRADEARPVVEGEPKFPVNDLCRRDAVVENAQNGPRRLGVIYNAYVVRRARAIREAEVRDINVRLAQFKDEPYGIPDPDLLNLCADQRRCNVVVRTPTLWIAGESRFHRVTGFGRCRRRGRCGSHVSGRSSRSHSPPSRSTEPRWLTPLRRLEGSGRNESGNQIEKQDPRSGRRGS